MLNNSLFPLGVWAYAGPQSHLMVNENMDKGDTRRKYLGHCDLKRLVRVELGKSGARSAREWLLFTRDHRLESLWHVSITLNSKLRTFVKV